jgi:DNA-binding beta-propeller fold protein YncE
MRLKALGVNLLVLAGSLVFLFLALEIVARVFLARPSTVLVDNIHHEDVRPTENKEFRSPRGLPGFTLFMQTETGLRLQPNVRVIIRGHELSGRNVEVRTNALGYRGDDVPPKNPDDFRILVLGDSITLSDYAPEDQTYPAFLEKRLAQLGPARKKLKVINAGTSSIDLRSEFMILMETGLQTKPDIVVEGLYLNDADVSFTLGAVTYPPSVRWSRFLTYLMSRTNYLKTMLQVREREEDRKEEKDHFLAAHPVSATADWQTDEQGFNREIADAFGDWGYAWTDDAWRKMEETLTLMKQVAADHDFELFVVLLPVKQQVQSKLLRDEPQRAFARVVKRLGLPHLDLLGPMRAQFARDGQNIFYDHCHYRPEGNELIGRLIADALAAESKRLSAVGIHPRADAPAMLEIAPATQAVTAPEILNQPQGVAVTADGEVLVADLNENRIERAVAGHFLPPLGAAVYQSPNGVAVDAKGDVYVADTWNQRIAVVARDGAPLGELPIPAGGFYAPRDVTVAPEGDIFVVNTGQSRIEHYDATRHYLGGWGAPGSDDGQFREPLGATAAGRELYVLDYGNARVQVFSFEGRFLRAWSVRAWKSAPISNRPALAFYDGRLYATDPVGNAVLVFSPRGEALGSITAPELQTPAGLAAGADGTLYVANIETGTLSTIRIPRGGTPVVAPFAPIR